MAGVTVAAVISLCWNVASLWIGPLVGVVDHPDDPKLKAHDRPAIPLGGFGIFLGVHLGMWLEGISDPGLLAATGLLLILGLADDVRRLSPSIRLLGEAGAGVLLALMSHQPFFDDGLVAVLVAVVLVVVAVNAVNLFDGLDGLVGTSMAVTGIGLAVLFVQRDLEPLYGWIVTTAVAGFLILNWHRARVFLGDNGAYVVGALLAYGILATGSGGVGSEFVVGLGLLGVFGLDVVVTVLRRRRYGRPLFEGDRSHIYDQLRDRGRSVPAVALSVGGVQAVVVVVVIAADVLGGWPGAAIISALGLLLVVAARTGGFLRVDES